MTIVTVPGANGATLSLNYDNNANAMLARDIAGAIRAGLNNHTIVAADSANGPPPVLPAGKTGEWVQSTSNTTILPSGYDNVVNTANGAVIFGSGGPNEHILSGDRALKFFATGGSGTIVTGAGNNFISIPASDNGAWTIDTGGGNDTIRAAGGGNDTISAGAGKNSIFLGDGNNTIFTTGADTIIAGAGSETIVARGEHASDVVFGNGSKLFFVAEGGATVFGGTGSDTVYGDDGPDLMFGGSAGNNLLIAGGGKATLFGGGNGDRLFAAGDEAQALHAAGGTETLFGGAASGNDTFYGGSGSDQITGGSGKNTFVAGTGSATIAASPGGENVFEFVKGAAGGTELVIDLTKASQVHIDLDGYGEKEIKQALAGQTHAGGGVTITLSDHTSITFQNISALTRSNFGGVG